MKKYGRQIIKGGLFILLLLGLVLPALPAKAGTGIGITPSSIDIVDAMRGSKYENSITIINSGDTATDYKVTVTGELAFWISLSYQGKPFEYITIAPGASKDVGVTVTVPGDAANRKYTAKVTASTVFSGSASSGAGQAVAVELSSNINVTVTGTQNISGNVNGIIVKDQETGFPLLLQVFFENTGNVNETPSIDVSIAWDGKAIDSFNYSGTEMRPSKKDFINVNWDTTGRVPGDYAAHVVVNLDGKQIYTQDLNFNILALGSLSRSGELGVLLVEGTLQPGKLAKISANFSNTGAANVMAKLTGEIYYNGSLVQTLGSDEVLVNSGRQATLASYFTPQDKGKYTVKAQADFGGKKTDVKEITVNIRAGQANSGSGNSNSLMLYIIGGGIVILIIAAVALFTIKKSHRKA